jgi:hypothetical protein
LSLQLIIFLEPLSIQLSVKTASGLFSTSFTT